MTTARAMKDIDVKLINSRNIINIGIQIKKH